MKSGEAITGILSWFKIGGRDMVEFSERFDSQKSGLSILRSAIVNAVWYYVIHRLWFLGYAKCARKDAFVSLGPYFQV